MEANDNIKDELKSLGSSLERLERKNPFAVPENYFENLNSLVQDKINARRKLSWPEQFAGFFAAHKLSLVTSMIVLVLGSVYYFRNGGSNIIPANETEFSFTDEEINTITSELDEQTISDAYAQTLSTDNTNDEGEFEDYILNNYIDENTLVNEL